jgi:hypothetical protein
MNVVSIKKHRRDCIKFFSVTDDFGEKNVEVCRSYSKVDWKMNEKRKLQHDVMAFV